MATSGREINERDRERIRKMREQGVSVRKCAHAMMVSTATVRKISQNSR